MSTVGTLNWPRKVLSERERTIQEAIARLRILLGSSASINAVNQLADQTITTAYTTSMTDITSFKLPVANGIYYEFRWTIIYQSATLTEGIALGLTTPAFTRYAGKVDIQFAADGAAATWSGALTTSGDKVVSTDVIAINTDYIATITGAILPSADGYLQVQAGSETGGTVKVRQGSAGIVTVTG